MKLCDKLFALRKKKGLTQEELANELQVSRQAVFKWECGENTPDLEKIKKLAKLYDVSFDVLLDDEKELDIESSKIVEQVQPVVNETIKFRKPFDSGVKMNASEQADYEHGYSGSKKVGYTFESSLHAHNKLILKKEYSKIIRVQRDILVDFFVDEKNKTFGFFFDGAPQFICPYENLAAFNLSNTGYHTGYTRSPVYGVGLGKNPSFTAGSMPLGQTRQPLMYNLSISYFDEKGSLKDFKLTFSCIREYILHDGTANSVDDLYTWENALSQMTNRNLNEIISYLSGIKEAGSILKQQGTVLDEIDTEAALSEATIGINKMKETVTANKKKQENATLTRVIVIIVLVLLGIVAAVVALVLSCRS